MDYDLRCEGFPHDEDLEERLLLRGRRAILSAGSRRPVRMTVKQVDGRVQGRVEIVLADRRVSAVVWRRDPEDALGAATDAVMDAIGEDPEEDYTLSRGGEAEEISTLQ